MADKFGMNIARSHYESRLGPFIGKPIIKIISGIRRCGKSSLLSLVSTRLRLSGIDESAILYINMESLENAKYADIGQLHTLVKARRQDAAHPICLLIDEVQDIPDWEKAVNSFLADGLADIYLSGSNSRLLAGELASVLSGRYVELQLFPLSFTEFRQFQAAHLPNPPSVNDSFDQFLKFGGFPGLHHIEFQQEAIYQYLASLADSVLLKDVVMRHKVRDVALLRSLLLFLADNCGSVFSARSIADYLKKERRSLGIETIYNYLQFLETAFVVYKASRYDLRGKRLLETHEKYYLADIGLRHALLGYREGDIGIFLENIVFIELRKRAYTVRIGKLDDLEIDFVATRLGSSGEERLYIQVCYLLAEAATREREYRPLRQVADNYPKLVLTMDSHPPGNDQGIERRYLPEWLLDD